MDTLLCEPRPFTLPCSTTDLLVSYRTADVAAKSSRMRRKSSTYVDAIHDMPDRGELAPAQLYSTESGRLFHSGLYFLGRPLQYSGSTLGDSIGLLGRGPLPA